MDKRNIEFILTAVVALSLGMITERCADDTSDVSAPKIYFASEGKYEISMADTLTLSPRILYDHNSKYTWYKDGEYMSNDLELEFVPDKMKDYTLTFEAENGNGTDKYDIYISVVNNVDFSKFDNFAIPKNSGLAMCPDTMTDFIVGNVALSNVLNADTTGWAGFAFSSKTSMTSSVSYDALGCAYTSNKHDAYMSVSCYSPGAVVDFGEKRTVKSIDIASDNFAYLVSKFGLVQGDTLTLIDYLKKDDFVRLHIKGLNENGNQTAEHTYDLIDCRYDKPSKYVRLSDWTTIELKDLGAVNGLLFEIESTQEDFPRYFCIDNIKLQE